jgi:hypothetical protein
LPFLLLTPAFPTLALSLENLMHMLDL